MKYALCSQVGTQLQTKEKMCTCTCFQDIRAATYNGGEGGNFHLIHLHPFLMISEHHTIDAALLFLLCENVITVVLD